MSLVVGSHPVQIFLFLPNELSLVISSSLILKSKTFAFSTILSGLDDFGIVTKPFCNDHLIRICAGVFYTF